MSEKKPPPIDHLVDHEEAHNVAESVIAFQGMQCGAQLLGTLYVSTMMASRAWARCLKEAGFSAVEVAALDASIGEGCIADIYLRRDLSEAAKHVRNMRAEHEQRAALENVVDVRSAAEITTQAMLSAIADVKGGWKKPIPTRDEEPDNGN